MGRSRWLVPTSVLANLTLRENQALRLTWPGVKIPYPSEHPNPHYNRLKWVVHLPQNGTIVFEPQPHKILPPFECASTVAGLLSAHSVAAAVPRFGSEPEPERDRDQGLLLTPPSFDRSNFSWGQGGMGEMVPKGKP